MPIQQEIKEIFKKAGVAIPDESTATF
jgi:hypothetical protein